MNNDAVLSVTDLAGVEHILYEPQDHQVKFHASQAPNLLALGTRGTGKSLMLRMDAILRCLLIPNFRALILRRTMPELRKSHLGDIPYEMEMLGGVFLQTTFQAKFPNGSTITFAHCEKDSDILSFLSSQYGFIGFDELSTFTLEQFLLISAAARAPEGCGYTAVVRAGSNPLGIGADWMYAWFVDKDVNVEDYPDYNPLDFEMQFSTLEDNKYMDKKKYEARLRNLPAHVRRAWLLGERVILGVYFEDFLKTGEGGIPWHVLQQLPRWKDDSILDVPWLSIYRAMDWGYFPDPAVCLWVAVLPNKKAVVFKERTWRRTLAADVAKDIKRESEGMRIVETFCDPSMFIKTGVAPYSIGEIIETNGVPLTPLHNDRALFGYAIHEYLNTMVEEGEGMLVPQLGIIKGYGPNLPTGCTELIRTLPMMRMDKNDPRKIADGDDHWVVALAYFCMGQAPPSRDPQQPTTKRWMRPKTKPRNLGHV